MNKCDKCSNAVNLNWLLQEDANNDIAVVSHSKWIKCADGQGIRKVKVETSLSEALQVINVA
jgi:hypothetical protein